MKFKINVWELATLAKQIHLALRTVGRSNIAPKAFEARWHKMDDAERREFLQAVQKVCRTLEPVCRESVEIEVDAKSVTVSG